ncbi:hypothetical protein F5I97DRAFT_1942431 [Phlebopus sp. FC_14]|nr:hypothetical protein F5I97DRAFT_1942431 [Phlebopus sp. FC_14]
MSPPSRSHLEQPPPPPPPPPSPPDLPPSPSPPPDPLPSPPPPTPPPPSPPPDPPPTPPPPPPSPPPDPPPTPPPTPPPPLGRPPSPQPYIYALRNASLEDSVSKLDDEALQRIRNPLQAPVEINASEIRHSISTYLAMEHSSQNAYEGVRYSNNINYPDRNPMLHFSEVERVIAQYTGVEKIQHDMCPNTCLAYTGRNVDLESCPTCGTSRWNQEKYRASHGRTKVAARKFTTIPLGPQIQARYRHPESAQEMQYLQKRTREILHHIREHGEVPDIDDVAMGWDFLGAIIDGDIQPHDAVVMVSLDGAQLYQSKESDCWIYTRYKKINVLPGGFIPGLKKPQDVDSFLFPGLHHISAVQKEGLMIWDSRRHSIFRSNIYALYETADGPGLVYWDGMVGHCGKNGCWLYCGIRGRRKTNQNHYSAALLKPRDRACPGSDHPDVNVYLLPPGGADEYADNLRKLVASSNLTQYNQCKTDTGLTKPPLILGLQPSHSLGIPFSITTDIMHLVANLGDLMLSLWRGTIKCDNTDEKDTWDWAIFRDQGLWDEHGEYVAQAGHYLPGSFDRKPHNIAEKISTQYKTWEYQLYLFGLAPALLYNVLPRKYWQNLCKLVRGIQLMTQHSISLKEIQYVQVLLCGWQLPHLPDETLRKGPPICYAQWTMECTIGNLGQEIRQPVNPYENLSQEGVRRCQVNALLAAIPQLNGPPRAPSSLAEDLGDGYALLCKRQKYAAKPIHTDVAAIQNFFGCDLEHPIQKWARVQLSNGQIARCAWREKLIGLDKLRVSRNVKFLVDDMITFGEVQYFTRISASAPHLGVDRREWLSIAVIIPYSEPNAELLTLSSQVVASYRLSEEIIVINIKKIHSIVGMIPHSITLPSGYEDYDEDHDDPDLE